MAKKLTQDEFEEEIYSIYGNEYTIVGEYLGMSSNIKVRHNKCNKLIDVKAMSLKLKVSTCPYCDKNSKIIDNDVFLYKVKEKYGDEFIPLSDYNGANNQIKMRHKNCTCKQGFFDFNTTPRNFLKTKCGCPYETCQYEHTIEDFKEKLFKYHPSWNCVSDEYINSGTPLDVICENGHPLKISFDNLDHQCVYCLGQKVTVGENDLWTTNPNIAKCLIDPDDGYKYSFGTNTKLYFKCPHCGTILSKIPSLLFNNDKIVCICNDGISYPEKFVCDLLKQLNVKFIYQASSSCFEWCGKYRYDYYLQDYNLIIEVHGRQHYDVSFINDVSKQQEIDNIKEALAKENNINYCVIDARFSEKEYIKDSIINNKNFTKYFNVDNMNWNKCNQFATSSCIREAAYIWNNENKNVLYIAEKLNIADVTAYRYLDKANDLKLCEFNHKEYAKNAKINAHKGKLPKNTTPVKSVETGIIYESQIDARRKTGASLNTDVIGNPNRTSSGQHWIYVTKQN